MWCHFEQSTVEDETISNNFSSRGIFRVRSEEEVKSYPNVQATLQNKRMVIAIDKNVLLLEDEMIAECSEITFASTIDVIAVSNSGNLIICGMRDGEVHGIFIKGILLFAVSIKLEDCALNSENGKTFTSVQEIDGRFHLICTNGSVYCLSPIDETPLENKLNVTLSENDDEEKILLESVTIERVIASRGGIRQISKALLVPHNGPYTKDLLLLIAMENELLFRSTTYGDSKATLPEQFNGVKDIINLDHLIVILTHSGHLLEVCPYTYLIDGPYKAQMENTNKLLIDELRVLECSDDNIELLILVKTDKSDDERCMKIVEFPSFKCISELDVPKHTWLVQQPKCSVNLYYLCGNRVNAGNCPNEVEMMLLSETHPMDRFKKLISKGHLQDAEEFGKQFELSLQPVYEAKAKRILLDIITYSENNPEVVDKRFGELFDLLGQIENKAFFCVNRMLPLPTRTLLEKYLQEIIKHLDPEEHKQDVLEVEEQLLRLQTLSIFDPYECDSNWKKFIYHSNLVEFIKNLFKRDILLACFIWKRHSSAIMPHLDDKGLCQLLNIIPSNTEAFNLVQWLRYFVPTIVNIRPNVMPKITTWVMDKTRALQYATHWPEIGLEFSEKSLEIFENIQYIHSDIRRQHEHNVEKLRTLTNALQNLVVLKNNYNLIITLDKYLNDSMDATAIYILERVHLNNLKSLVNDFLYPIYQAIPVKAIKRYVSALVASRNVLSVWLERAVVCTELIDREDERLECALLVLRSATVPWPEIVTPLLRLRHCTHPLAQKIDSEYEFQVIKIMKVKYGWPADSAADINLNLFMQRIVKLDLPDMLDDIRTLTKVAPDIASSANFNCCYHLVRRGKADLAYEYFKSLCVEKDTSYTKDIIELFATLLESTVLHSEDDERQVEEQRQLIDFFKLIALNLDESTRKRVSTIDRRFTLQHKFQLHVPDVQQLVAREYTLQLLSKGIENIIERSQAAVGITRFITNEISALSEALTLPRLAGVWRISQRIQCLQLTCALTYGVLEFIAEDTANLDDNRYDIIELASELIVQQMCLVSNKQIKESNRILPPEDEDPLALLLAYELLLRVYMTDENQSMALMELLKYLYVVKSVYATTAIDDYYGSTERQTIINERICKMLDANELQFSTNTVGASVDTSFDVKPQIIKKRNSVSVFDDYKLNQQAQQPNMNNCNSVDIVCLVARTLLVLIVNDVCVNDNEYFKKIQQRLPATIQMDIDGSRDDFYQSFEQLNKSKNTWTWYTVTLYLLDQQLCSNANIIKADLVSQKLGRVFRNALNQHDINFMSHFVMLIADEHREALLQKLQKELRSDQQKINFHTLLEMYNIHLQNTTKIEEIRMRRLKHFYYLDFCKQDPSIRGKFNVDVDDIEELLKEFHHKKLDVQLLQRMSRDFGLEYQQLLIRQLTNTLLAQELQYEIKTDSFGDEKLVLVTSVDEMRKLCQPYLDEITNTEFLGAKLLHVMQSTINAYFYELYLCIIEMLVFIDAAPKEMQIWSSILQFLKHKMVTRRRSRHSQLEIDSWLQSQTELSVLPKIARYRLPFKPIVEQPLKDILDNELDVDNCESWFPLIQLHTSLKGSQEITKMTDYFCMSAVKNSIAEYKAKNDSDTWHLQPTNNAFLKSIQRLIKHVQNPSKAFLTLYFVANYAPEGADQVEASYECYKYAMDHEADITDAKNKEQMVKIGRKYHTLKTQHLLYTHGLVDEKLMRLVDNPMELICKLYHHEIILQPTNKLNLNAVVAAIAELHGLEIRAMQFQLLQKWLSVTLDCADNTVLEDTFYDYQTPSTTNHATTDDSSTAAENVIRAHYILSSWPKKDAVEFLVAHMFNTNSAVNTTKQLQLCECLVKLNDGSTTFNNILEQNEYIAIKCVHELKKLGYNTTTEKFENCNKIQLLKALWQRNAQTPQALIILANICLGYDIFEAKVWNGILKRMTILNMVRELSGLVDALSCRNELLHIDGLCSAWECVLMHPFKMADRTRSSEQEELLHTTLFRLQSCPLLHKLNLCEFAQYCVQMERIDLAAVLLAMTKNTPMQKQIKELITRCTPKAFTDDIRKEILALEESGILPVILNVALKELNL